MVVAFLRPKEGDGAATERKRFVGSGRTKRIRMDTVGITSDTARLCSLGNQHHNVSERLCLGYF